MPPCKVAPTVDDCDTSEITVDEPLIDPVLVRPPKYARPPLPLALTL